MMEPHSNSNNNEGDENASHLTDPSSAWGNMGGAPGDGIAGHQQAPGATFVSPQQQQPIPNMIVGNNTPNPPAQSYYSPQQSMTPPTTNNTMAGSITRFATPEMQQQQQYAARSSQQTYVTQQPSGSYAARSAQAYATTGGYGNNNMNSSYNNRSAGNPSPQQPYPSGNQQQQHPYQQPPPPNHVPQQQQQSYMSQQSPASVASSSYAARSVQAHSVAPVPQQQQVQHVPNNAMPQQYQQQLPNNAMQQPSYMPQQQQQPQPLPPGAMTPQAQALQQRLLTDATRKVQEHAYYMKQAMEQRNLPVVLDRAAHMVGELGGAPPHHQQQQPAHNTGASVKLTPKNYYELYMRALEEMPTLQDFLVSQAAAPPADQITIVNNTTASSNIQRRTQFTVRELYDCTQYCPRVLSRLYLQITAGAALIESGEAGAKYVLEDLIQVVKSEQNPVRGLFLRHYLLTALRDKLPDSPVVDTTTPDDTTAAADDTTAQGTVQDSYEFVLQNFMEMNKLWVRIQHLPGEGKNKDVRKRRERERNDLRILVGTNLIRLSQLEHVTSKIYGEVILNQILEHIVTCGDPLSQAYLMDCLVQAFPDEYHIETMPILLNVCPRLRDKVNIRTILQGLMDRLANYLADEELLDENDTNDVKKHLARESFGMFEECVQKVYNARGPKLTSKEVIRLQTALLNFSARCYPDDTAQVAKCLGSCVAALRQANASYEMEEGTVASVPQDKIVIKALDEVSVAELEKLLSIPLDKWGLECLKLEHYSELIGFLPWENRRQVAMTLLKAVDAIGAPPSSVGELEELFHVIEPLIRDETPTMGDMSQTSNLMANLGVSPQQAGQTALLPEKLKQVEIENGLVCKFVHLIRHEQNGVMFDLLEVARKHIGIGERHRVKDTAVAIVYAALRLVRKVFHASNGTSAVVEEGGVMKESTEAETGLGDETEKKEEPETGEPVKGEGADAEAQKQQEANSPELEIKVAPDTEPSSIDCRGVFVFVQETVAIVAKADAVSAVLLYLEMALLADSLAVQRKDDTTDFPAIEYELLSQAFALFEEVVTDPREQKLCIEMKINTLLSAKSLTDEEYELLITKVAQFAAKVASKPDQCQLVALCAYLFYPVREDGAGPGYKNPQRALECLQRSLKLADSCTSANPVHVGLFVELLEHYIFFFEKRNPAISHAYITGLVALIKEHLGSRAGDQGVEDARSHLQEVLNFIRRLKSREESAELFQQIQVN